MLRFTLTDVIKLLWSLLKWFPPLMFWFKYLLTMYLSLENFLNLMKAAC